MSVTSVLSSIGHGLKAFFGGAIKVAKAAEPFVDIALPGIATLYNATIDAVVQAEAASIAAGAQTGSGPQKLAWVVSAIEGQYDAFAKANNITYDATHVEQWANAVVACLNSIPPPNQ